MPPIHHSSGTTWATTADDGMSADQTRWHPREIRRPAVRTRGTSVRSPVPRRHASWGRFTSPQTGSVHPPALT